MRRSDGEMKEGNFLDDLRRQAGRIALRIMLWSYGFKDQKSWKFYNQIGASIKLFIEFFKEE